MKSPTHLKEIPEVWKMRNGGSYNYIIQGLNDATPQLVEITPANNVHILWLLPQYILMAWGEILFIVSGMEFAFSEVCTGSCLSRNQFVITNNYPLFGSRRQQV